MEINCKINEQSEIDPLIPWFIENFWQPLIVKLKKVTEDYEGIKVVAVISSKLPINQRLSEDNLSRYCNKNYDAFSRDKLVKIPLDDWTINDISNLLKKINPALKKPKINSIANRIYQETQGLPDTIYHALKEEWQTLTNSPNSC